MHTLNLLIQVFGPTIMFWAGFGFRSYLLRKEQQQEQH